MKYPISAIEACEALSQPLPHPTMPIDYKPSTDDLIVQHLHQKDGGAKVNTTHPGPVQMFEPPEPSRIDKALVWLAVGVIAGLMLVAVAGPLIENLPALMGATAK